MATTNEPIPFRNEISRGNPQELEEYTITTMAEAMEVARSRVREFISEDPDPYGMAQEAEQEYGVDILNPQWKAKPTDELWSKRVRARARKTAVVRQFLLGFTVPEIAAKLKVTEATVYGDIRHAGKDWRRTYLDDIEKLAGMDLARMDLYLSKLAAGIEKGDVKAIQTAVDIIDKRSKILGYQQGVQIDIEQYVREVAEANGYDPEKAVMIASRISMNMRG